VCAVVIYVKYCELPLVEGGNLMTVTSLVFFKGDLGPQIGVQCHVLLGWTNLSNRVVS